MRAVLLATIAVVCSLLTGCQSLTVDGWIWCDHFDPDAETGYWIEVSSSYLEETSFRDRWSVVGEEGPHVKVEFQRRISGSEGAERATPVFGLVVERATGRIIRAVHARPGDETVDEAGVRSEELAPSKADPTDAAEETIEVRAGKFRARKETYPGAAGEDFVKWVGLEGPATGIDVKVQEGEVSVSLLKIEEQELVIGDRKLPVIYCQYDNGRENWLTREPLPFIGRHVKMTAGSISTEVVVIGDDAKPSIAW